MKFVLRDLSIGQTLTGRVEELLPGDEILICFGGDLIRVHNETRKTLRVGDQVSVIVRELSPLKFQLHSGQFGRVLAGRLDVSI